MLNANVPLGELTKKWEKYKSNLPLVSPANKQKLDIIVIGTGLAGASAAASLAEMGYRVKTFCFQDSPRRAHSIAAQGGINAALESRGDNWDDHAYNTVKGSDYLGDQDAIEIMCQEAGPAVLELEHMGVIFNLDEDGRLGTRHFGGQEVARTFFVADITGQA